MTEAPVLPCPIKWQFACQRQMALLLACARQRMPPSSSRTADQVTNERLFCLQGRSKSLTHIDTLDAGMLVSREEADCRSEPDTCLLVASSAGSQDRLVVPPSSGTLSTAAATSASGCQSMSASSGSSASGQSLPFSAAPPAPIIPQGSVDSAVRRRRLSNLYKVSLARMTDV